MTYLIPASNQTLAELHLAADALRRFIGKMAAAGESYLGAEALLHATLAEIAAKE